MVVADAPARALVIFGDGLMHSISPSHSHLHALAASGACGFLAVRHTPPNLDNESRSLYEMQQLLDIHRFAKIDKAPTLKEDFTMVESSFLPIAERFMGMKTAFITNSKAMANLGKSLGFTVSNSKVGLGFMEPSREVQLPASANVASGLLELLGLSTFSKDSSSFELVLLHVSEGAYWHGEGVSRGYLDWIDLVIGDVKALMQPGTNAGDHLYVSLVLSYGNEAALQTNEKDLEVERVKCVNSLAPDIRSLCPQQTYTMKNGSLVPDVRNHHPMLVVHQMDGVTRRDSAALLDFEEFSKNGCNRTILVDRFLHEVAFKLWKAPKYGA